jgi:spore maturation protein CgeB
VKALVVHPGPHWSVSDVYRGTVRGLRANGVEVREFNLNDRMSCYENAHFKDDHGDYHPMWPDAADVSRLVGHGLHSACYQFQPDLVVTIAPRFLPMYVWDIIRERRTKVVTVFTESPYEDDRQIQVAEHCDLAILNDPLNLERFAQVVPTMYVPHAYDPAVHHPGPSRFTHDVCWVGTAGETFPSRTEFMEKVDWSGVDLALGGLWAGVDESSPLWPHIFNFDCVDNDETVEHLRGSSMTFNLYRTDMADDSFVGGWAMGPREVEAAATGCFMARHSPPDHGGEGDDVLPMLPTFTDPVELTEIVRHYLADDVARQQIADQAREAVADRTFENHAAEVLRRIS